MRTSHYMVLVSCLYLTVAFANVQLKFTHLEIIQGVWLVLLTIPLNRWLASKLGIRDAHKGEACR